MQAAIVSTAAAPPIAGRIGAWKHQRPVACRRTGTQRQVKHCQQVYVRAAAGADNKTAANGNGNGNGAVAPVAIPTRLNTIPHERTTRQFFYQQTTAGILKAVAAGETRISARCVFPELNTEFDVYRIGTMLELVREVVTALTADGKRVKVCVQQALGKGVFMGLPLSLNGVMRIMDKMDWGEHADLITRGNMGAAEVESADAFVLISPQNIVGHSIMPILSEMADAAEGAGKPLILINPKLTDIQSAGGVGSVRGRQGRLDFIATFVTAFHFRLLYRGAAMHPIMGALRYEYGGPWEVYRRVELGPGVESYNLIGSFDKEPTPTLITDAFRAAWDRD